MQVTSLTTERDDLKTKHSGKIGRKVQIINIIQIVLLVYELVH